MFLTGLTEPTFQVTLNPYFQISLRPSTETTMQVNKHVWRESRVKNLESSPQSNKYQWKFLTCVSLMGRKMSPWYSHLVIVSRRPILTAINEPSWRWHSVLIFLCRWGWHFILADMRVKQPILHLKLRDSNVILFVNGCRFWQLSIHLHMNGLTDAVLLFLCFSKVQVVNVIWTYGLSRDYPIFLLP